MRHKAISRREFIGGAVVGLGALYGCSPKSLKRVVGANDTIRVAVVGVHSQGNYHVELLSKAQGARVVAVCDPDRAVRDMRIAEWAGKGVELEGIADIRRLLDRKDIDAISIAAPNHWHSLATVWACQAGKDVYVEKPVSHGVWEGRKCVEAARRYGRIVQAGTQKRSNTTIAEAFGWLREGNLGRILWARGLCYKRRGSIGKVDGPQKPPESLDYDIWTGPAPMKPLMRKNLHYDWHWVWDTGNGDLGNQGIHEMDLARWALGAEGLPPRVLSFGGRFGYADDGETANTQVAFLDYPGAPLIFEVRGLPSEKGSAAMDVYRQTRIGYVIQCEKGYFAGGDGGGWIYDNSDKRVRQFSGWGDEGHFPNWLKAVRSRKAGDLNADIEKGHISSALCHMGNISYRLGKSVPPDEVSAAISGNAEMKDSYDRMMAHLEKNGVDPKAAGITLGAALEFDPATEKFTGALADPANALARREYRKPFTIPETV
jgi:predicted dehydrogenase